MDLVAHVNALHWDGPLRGWLTCIARHSSPTEIEIAVGLGNSEPRLLVVPKPARPNCDDAAALTKQIVDAAGLLLAEAAASLLRRGPRLDLRVPTLADLQAEVAELKDQLEAEKALRVAAETRLAEWLDLGWDELGNPREVMAGVDALGKELRETKAALEHALADVVTP